MSELLTVDVDGPIHYVDHPGPSDDAPVMVLVHGLGASHLSWTSVIPLLRASHRVVALDLPGFGHSAPGERSVTVTDNRDYLARFIRKVTDGPVTLVGNSMGGMIAALVAHAHPGLVDAVVLVDPALPGSFGARSLRSTDPRLALHFVLYNIPAVGEGFMRWRRSRSSPTEAVEALLDGACADPSRVDPDVVELLVDNTAARRDYDWSDPAFLEAERSILRMLTTGRSKYEEVLASTSGPKLLVHGEQDGLVSVVAARAVAERHAGIDLVTLPGVGHAPQLEVPEDLAGIISEWLAELPVSQAR